MIIDSHTHVFPPEVIRRREELLDRDVTLSAMFTDPRSRMADAEELVATMDGAAVDLSVMVGIGWNDPGLAREANDYLRHRRGATLSAAAQGLLRRQPGVGRRSRR